MLHSSAYRSVAFLLLSAVYCVIVRPHVWGEEIDWRSEVDLAEPNDLLLAFQPGDISEEARPASPSPPDVLDQRGPRVTPRPADRFPPSSMLASRSPIVRLAGMPNMYGDFFANGCQIIGWGLPGGLSPQFYDGGDGPPGGGDEEYRYHVEASLPSPGGGTTMKMSENNKALPMDRLFLMYNRYTDALYVVASPRRSFSVDRFTIGAEKTLLDGRCSVEVRMPFTDSYQIAEPDFGLSRGEVGNLGFAFKQLLWVTQTASVAAGLGVDFPTGSDITGLAGSSEYTLYNDAVHLLPFIGFLKAPNDYFFYQGFLQLDIAANSNRVIFGGTDLGRLTEQNLLFIDLSVGRWLIRNPSAYRFRGLAALVEFHYTTTLQDTDTVSGLVGLDYLELHNTYNRTDVSNFTVGLHGEIGQTTIRVGGVFPLRNGSDKQFDAEFQVSMNRRF